MLIVLLTLLFSVSAHAQQRFKAGIIAGGNASQIDGDNSIGYNKLGLHAGITGITILNERSEFAIEFIYSQRGSQTKITPGSNADRNKISLNYVAVPLVFTYKDWLSEKNNTPYYRVQAHGGLSYARLISTSIQDQGADALSEHFNENDVSWLIGASYFINEHFGFTFRYNRFVTMLFNNNKNTQVNANSLRVHYLTFRGVYIF